MTKEEEIIEIARKKADYWMNHYDRKSLSDMSLLYKDIEAFAKLVAAQTLMKIDPSSFMSYQEGFEAGQLAEREGCAKLCDGWSHANGDDCAEAIRARGQE